MSECTAHEKLRRQGSPCPYCRIAELKAEKEEWEQAAYDQVNKLNQKIEELEAEKADKSERIEKLRGQLIAEKEARRKVMDESCKPKFKMSREELLAFNDECSEAALSCPQISVNQAYVFSDREILLGKTKAKEIIKYWMDSSVLWDKGYSVELDGSGQAEQWIEKYKDYKAAKRLWEQEKSS